MNQRETLRLRLKYIEDRFISEQQESEPDVFVLDFYTRRYEEIESDLINLETSS